MGLKVIGAGFGRTGTASLKVALEHLGYAPCHHMKEVFPSLEQINWFDQASRGDPVDWDKVFSKFQASVDWPSVAYYQELAEHFPDAKVVLSVRDAEAWHKSVSETIYAISNNIPTWLRFVAPPVDRICKMIYRLIWDGTFSGEFENRDFAIGVFNKHIEDVKQIIPAERLLIHTASEGWQPLCDFLGKPLPDLPYPRVNEAKELKRAVIVLKILRWVPALAIVLLTLGLVWD
ncbi:MAG: sulfotransferase family protein [bacterium]